MPKRPCPAPGCGELVDRGYCSNHNPSVQRDKLRGTAHSRGYDRDWDRVRRQALKRDDYLCVKHRKLGMLVPADEVDHIIPVDVWPAGRLVLSNTQSLCHPHHVEKTWDERKGRSRVGVGNP